VPDTSVVALRGQARYRRTSRYTLPTDNGEQVSVRVRSTGRRLSRYRWRGTFSSSIVIRRDGRVVDRCRMGARRWSASTPQARLTMSSDRGEYVLQGKSYRYSTPRNRMPVQGNRFGVAIEAGPWSIEIMAAPGRWLRPGRYTGALRYPFNGERPGISVTGDGRGCNEVTGEFTVRSSSFGPRGGLRAIDVSFVHRCEGGDKALRGRFTYRR
jgi:hypothetical protein